MPGIEDCLRQVMAIQGARGASLIDSTSGLTVRSAGQRPGGRPEVAAAGAAKLVHAALDTAAFAAVGRPGHVEDIVITADNGYHVLHFVMGGVGGRMVLYVWLDRMLGNLALAQRMLRSLGGALAAR